MRINDLVEFNYQGYRCRGIVIEVINDLVAIEITDVLNLSVEEALGSVLGCKSTLPKGTVTKHIFELTYV